MITGIIFGLCMLAGILAVLIGWAIVTTVRHASGNDRHEFEHGDPNVIHHTRAINGTHRAEWPERRSTARIRDIEPRGA